MLRYDDVPESVKTRLLHMAAMPVMQAFALGGGTSLALGSGHRLSVDLDFLPLHEFAPESLGENLEIDPVTMIDQAANSLTLDVGAEIGFVASRLPNARTR